MWEDPIDLHDLLAGPVLEGVAAHEDLDLGEGVDGAEAVGGAQQPAGGDQGSAAEGVVPCKKKATRYTRPNILECQALTYPSMGVNKLHTMTLL